MLLAKLAGELTVLPTRLYIAKETVLSEIKYAPYRVADGIDKATAKMKSKDFKLFKKKEKTEEVKAEPVNETVAEEVKETVVDVEFETVVEEPTPEIVTESGLKYTPEGSFTMNIPVEEQEPTVTMDYSKCVRGVTYDDPEPVPVIDEELKPVTQEDCDIALKKMKANQVK